jgi:preprotein translocase subunit SecB
MQPSVLQLERSFFRRIEISASPTASAVPPKLIEADVSSGRAAENPLRYQVTLVIRILDGTEKESGYKGEVEVIGFFTISDSIPDKDRDQIVSVHGSTLLFGMAREMICNITARGPWPMFVLPTVTFQDLKPAIGMTAATGDVRKRLRQGVPSERQEISR